MPYCPLVLKLSLICYTVYIPPHTFLWFNQAYGVQNFAYGVQNFGSDRYIFIAVVTLMKVITIYMFD